MQGFLRGFLVVAVFLTVIDCGSTKVIQGQKTVSYQGDIYNLSSVTKISSRIETSSPEGEVVNLRGVDKKQFQTYVADWEPLKATSYIDMDAQHMVYQTSVIKKHSELRRMESNLSSAMSSIQSFMKSKKASQLKLR